jgi:hypothetical protein
MFLIVILIILIILIAIILANEYKLARFVQYFGGTPQINLELPAKSSFNSGILRQLMGEINTAASNFERDDGAIDGAHARQKLGLSRREVANIYVLARLNATNHYFSHKPFEKALTAQNIMAAANARHVSPYILAKYLNAPKNVITEIGARDVNAPQIQAQIRNNSLEFEGLIAAYLRDHNVAFKTEDELRNQANIATPDFLLKTPIKINGHKVYWIEAKDMPLIDYFFIHKTVKRQAAKYLAAYGPGAFIFSCGLGNKSGHIDAPKATIDAGILMLDGRFLFKN